MAGQPLQPKQFEFGALTVKKGKVPKTLNASIRSVNENGIEYHEIGRDGGKVGGPRWLDHGQYDWKKR